jgi:hypothetical protein
LARCGGLRLYDDGTGDGPTASSGATLPIARWLIDPTDAVLAGACDQASMQSLGPTGQRIGGGLTCSSDATVASPLPSWLSIS